MRGVVDSDSLPLNVNRETLQVRHADPYVCVGGGLCRHTHMLVSTLLCQTGAASHALPMICQHTQSSDGCGGNDPLPSPTC